MGEFIETLVTITGMVDRFLFSIGCILTIIFVVLKFTGRLEFAWYWIFSPFWIWLVLSFLRNQFIVKPAIKEKFGKKF
jgi:hypothetical protein